MAAWRLRDRTLSFPPPRAAGIVNVTDDSFFEGARSGTPERAIEDGLALVGGRVRPARRRAPWPARSGPPVAAEDEAARLVPAVEGLAARAGVPVLADTFSAEVARAGARRRRGRDQRHLGRRGPRPARGRGRRRRGLRADAHRGAAAGRTASRPRYARPGRAPEGLVRGADRGAVAAGGDRARADRARPRPRLRPLVGRRPRGPASRSASCARWAPAVRRPLAQGLPRAPSLAGSWEERAAAGRARAPPPWRRRRSPWPRAPRCCASTTPRRSTRCGWPRRCTAGAA